MIKFNIKNFKCFYDVSININGLTVLAGANGYGKSSVIQALLLFRSTIEHNTKWLIDKYSGSIDYNLNIELNHSYCLSLGRSNDITPIDVGFKSKLQFEMAENNNMFCLSYPLDDSRSLLWIKIGDEKNRNQQGDYRILPLFEKEWYYLNAERIGPRIAQKVKSHDYPNVGWQGEYTAQILDEYGFKNELKTEILVENERLFDINDTNKQLLKQTQDWMQYLMPGITIDARQDMQTQTAQILVGNSYTNGKKVIATNIGFGISYVLPIVVTGLIARKGTIMIVENPEAHLHPSAQSRIGQFLARIAQSGVKVIVETHSDHVINGIQIATAQGKINNELVSINHFSERDTSSEFPQPKIEEISVTKKGELTNWPKGFFDQTQIDYSELLKSWRNV